MDFIKYFDFFSIKFHFYTNKQPKFRNIFGGIMSLFYLIICSIIFVSFSYEDLFKLKPISSKSEISFLRPKTAKINKEKLWIPFRIVTYEEKFIDHRQILYILPYFVEGKHNEEIGMELKYRLLEYKLCNETSMVNISNNYKIDVPLNQLFCIDENDFEFGGSWSGDFINYIEINLYLCKDGINFNSSDSRCTKMEDLLKYKKSSWLFEFFYPVVQFQPTNLNTPMTVIYRNYFYILSAYSNKVERLYLQENILSDDRNLIINNYKNMSYWGMSSLQGDDYIILNESEPINNSSSSRLYSLNVYMDNGLIYYTRTYKKLFLILSEVFPLFRFFLYFFKTFTQHVKMSLTKRKLVGLIFEKKEKSGMSLIKLNCLKGNFIQEKEKNKKGQNDSSKELIIDKNINHIPIDNKNNNDKKDNNQNYNNKK